MAWYIPPFLCQGITGLGLAADDITPKLATCIAKQRRSADGIDTAPDAVEHAARDDVLDTLGCRRLQASLTKQDMTISEKVV